MTIVLRKYKAFVTVAVIAMLATSVCAADSRSSQSAPDAGPCVALLEAEYITPDAAAIRGELTGWLDTVLTDSLTGQKNLTVLDRQLLDKLLAEKKFDAARVDAALRPFIASGVLICPTIVADPSTGKAVVTVQAVLAQRGDMLAELIVTGELVGDGWKNPPATEKLLAQFWRDLNRGIEARVGLPSLEVRDIALDSKTDRLQWLADDLTDALAAQPREGLVLLVPRQTVHTKEERLLRLMGLSSPADGDKSAGFAATSDYQLSGELIEEVKPDVPFDQTPIKLVLHLTTGDKQLTKKELSGTVGQYTELRRQAILWAADELAKATKIKATQPDQSHVKAMAEQELAAARRLTNVTYGGSNMERDRKQRLALAALRAAHLNPTSEEAAFLVVQSIEGLYESRGQRNTLACWDRLLAEAEKYIDRFGDRNPQHHCRVLDRMGHAGFRGDGLLMEGPTGTRDMLSPPDERRWRYVRAYVLANLEIGVRGEANKVYDLSNALQSMPGHIRLHLVPSIPADKLDDEYWFWREFWRKRLEPLGDDKCIPWDCIEMSFAARRKDVDGVKAAAQRLAAKYPRSRTDIWRLLRDDAVSLCLRAAGSKDWNTWQPDFAKSGPPKIALVPGFYESWRPANLTAWDYTKAVVLPSLRITFADEASKRGKSNYVVPHPKVECFLVAGGDAWLASPCLWDSVNNRPHHLLVVPVSACAGREQVEAPATPVSWPVGSRAANDGSEPDNPIITCWSATTGPDGDESVWIGTRDRGLARFDKNDGGWTGQWYASRQGMPSERILSIMSFGPAGKQKLLVVGGGPRDKAGTKLFVWSLDAQSGQIRLLEAMPAAYSMGTPTAVWPDGRRIPLWACGQPAVENLDAGSIKEITTIGPRLPDWPVEGIDLAFMRGGEGLRLWQIGKGRRTSICEISLESLEALPLPQMSGPVTVAPNGRVPAPCRFSSLVWQNLSEGLPTDPLDKVCSSLIVGQDIWMVVRPYEHVQHRGEGFYIMIYRPAPPGEKDWSGHDQWIGPFKLPGGGTIFRLTGDNNGGVWVTGTDAVYRVEPKALLASARKEGLGLSTEQWRKAFEHRAAQAEWPVCLRVMLVRKQYKQAFDLVETKLAELGDAKEDDSQDDRTAWTQAMLHKALILGCQEQWDDALAAYAQVGESGVEPGRSFAAREAMWILAMAERWPEFLKAVEAQDLKLVEGDVLTSYVRQARMAIDKASRQANEEKALSQP